MTLPEELSTVESKRIVVTTRVFYVSVELAYEAWSNPAHLHRWWGPEGFTNQFYEYEFEAGGQWNFDMVGPTGVVYPNECTFRHIEESHCIIWEHHSQPKFTGMVQFEAIEDVGTRVTYTMIFPSIEEATRLRAFVTQKNEENFDRLEKEMESMVD